PDSEDAKHARSCPGHPGSLPVATGIRPARRDAERQRGGVRASRSGSLGHRDRYDGEPRARQARHALMSDCADRAYVAGLTLLARRELAEHQLRERLARRKFEPDEIDAAVTRLRRERAIDDRRTALACARTEMRV